MKAKFHRTVQKIAEYIQGMLIIALIIAILGIGAVDDCTEWDEAISVFFFSVGQAMYILSAICIMELLKRSAGLLHKMERRSEQRKESPSVDATTNRAQKK